MARLLIVSNRLPISVQVTDGQPCVERSAGGLATGLRGPHERSGGLWIGWDGDAGDLDDAQRAELGRQLAEQHLVPVSLKREDVERYYQGFSNSVLWPLFHYFPGQLPLHSTDFDSYVSVNERFADAVVRSYRPGDVIWVHDYQLLLVPEMIRRRIPEARIGFFLHIPFPASEVFRTLPHRERLLEGMLGADLIGFHTAAYATHFASAVLRILGRGNDVDKITWQHRLVRLGPYPMGIDAEAFTTLARAPAVEQQVRELRGKQDTQLLVGIDRLDYTKGIPRRLLAFEALLRTHPELGERVRLVQVAVPSRENVGAYQDLRSQVDGLIGRIHGEFATPRWVPIHYLFRSLSEAEIVALYRAADVMVVTPVRDGMNLVAKEFAAARIDEDGVLVLSEFAGAASELAEAVRVNPYDVDRSAEALYQALTMAADERRTRMRALRRRVLAYDVHRWARSFLDDLERGSAAPELASARPSPPALVREVMDSARAAPNLVLLLDYDGTLVPFADTPELARPDRELLALLRSLATRPHTQVHVVSGRTRETLEHWLGELPIGLHAEHGFWSRMPGSGEWTHSDLSLREFRAPVLAALQDVTARTPGSLIEEKTAALAWHYRMADPDYGPAQANELRLHLSALLSNAPVEILPGQKVIEIRPHGAHKGRVVEPILQTAPANAVVVAMGDDRTDQDLFAALPANGISIQVGDAATGAQLRLADVRAARAFLALLAGGNGREMGMRLTTPGV